MGAEAEGMRVRRLPLSGAANFRDLGGYRAADGRRMRWNLIYRADSLSHLTEEDLDLVAGLGIAKLIDFRIPREREERPNRLPAGQAIETIHLPFIPAGTLDMLRRVKAGTITTDEIQDHVRGHYRRFAVDHHDVYRRLIDEVFAAGGRPVLFHCTSGKDRTGFGAAVILLAAGVSRDDIRQDYDLTNLYRRDVSQFFSPSTPPEVPHTLTSAFPAYIDEALATIDQVYGSADAYLEEGLGLTPERRADFVALVTEPDDGQT
jgi:protein-tyrosine phosphatase